MRRLHNCSFCKSFRFYPDFVEGYYADYGEIECVRRPSEAVYYEMPVIVCGWFSPKSEEAATKESEWFAKEENRSLNRDYP